MLSLAAGAIMVSFSAPIVQLLTTPPTVTAFYRMLSGGLILLAIVLLQGGRVWPGRRSFLLACGCGLAFACDLSLWHRSIRLVGPGLATILVSVQVFYMAAFGLLFGREKVNWRLALGIPLAVIGLILIVGLGWRSGGSGYRLGIIFGLVTALCYTTYLLLLRRLQNQADGLTRMANIATLSLISALFLGIISLTQRESFAITSLPAAGLLILYGVIGQVLAWVLMSRAIPYLRTSVTGLILLLQPALSSVWDVLFFHRNVTLVEVAGAALTLGAIYLGATASQPTPAPDVPHPVGD
jgi:drug/metabolite transporter (DMT)-like permease